jgi:hypothetical protein
MGYQESFIKFLDEDTMVEQLEKYMKRNRENDLAEIVCVDRVKKDIAPFKKGEFLAVVSGERSAQRGAVDLYLNLGLDYILDIKFMDDYLFQHNFDIDFPAFLEEHFEKIPLEEYLKEKTKERRKWDSLFAKYQALENFKKSSIFPRLFGHLQATVLHGKQRSINGNKIYEIIEKCIDQAEKGE